MLHLSAIGHDLGLADSGVRRSYDDELGTSSLVPIGGLDERVRLWQDVSGHRVQVFHGDICDPAFVDTMVGRFEPDAVVHFAEQRSAPYSMINQAHAVHTQVNNVVGTLNLLYSIAGADRGIHLVKLGTMGEYGTPNIDIEEGWLEITHNGRTDRVLYPKRPGSFYHLSKVHDSHNIEFACRTWGLAATDLNQGIVYGVETAQTVLEPGLATRFDYDHVFGTVLNRMVVEAVIGDPLTVYGSGGQVRGFLDIRDTVECVRLALEHPAGAGEFRVFNQFTEQFSVAELAGLVVDAWPGHATIETVPNPRVEAEGHYYHAAHTGLLDLGLQPHLLADTLIESLFSVVEAHRDRVDSSTIQPTIYWNRTDNTPVAVDVTAPAGPRAGRG